jgi:hypothetical protein
MPPDVRRAALAGGPEVAKSTDVSNQSAAQVNKVVTAARMRGGCQCNHDPRWFKAEIDAGRYPQEYRVGENGEYLLVCVKCSGLWDHRATDRLIDLVMRGEWAGARP